MLNQANVIMKKTYTIFLLGLGLILGGCGANYYVKKGNKKFDALAFSEAIPQYKKAIDKNPSSYQAKLKLADSYRLTNNPAAAEELYREVVAMPESKPLDQFFFGKTLMQNQKYGEAKTAFEVYAKSVPDDPIVKSLIEAAANPGSFDGHLDTCAYSLEKIETSGLMNAQGASPYNFGYVFSGETPPEGVKVDPYDGLSYTDLYFAKKDKSSGKWSAPEQLKGGVNSEYHDAFSCFSADGQTMYFTRTRSVKGKIAPNKAGVANLEILKAVFLEGEWTNVESLSINSPDFSNAHPALSADGKSLYFSSDREGGYGQSDLYVSNWNGSAWDAPVNLGPMINTAGREVMPQIGFDEKLYFSSDGQAGLGGLDIFSTTKNGSSWTRPVNLKSPINSSRDDFSFTIDSEGKVGNLTSSRSGTDQMYEVIYKDVIVPVEICVQDKESKKPVSGANVYALNKATGSIDSTTSDGQGKAYLRLAGNADFTVSARSNQTLTNSFELTTREKSCSSTIKTCDEGKVIEVVPAIAGGGTQIDLKNFAGEILYDYNKFNIRPDAALVLDKLVTLMNDNPSYKFQLGSHTDCRGDNAYNQRLSESRAKAVVKYCTIRDIDAKRLSFKGYGETQLKENCDCKSCTEEQHQANRRTTFELIK